MRVAHRGFTLVESLLACVILAIVMLGSSMMLLGGLRALRASWHRAEAAVLVTDLLERFRANAAGAADYALALDEQVNAISGTCGTPCPPATVARSDLAEWQMRVLASLPAARMRATPSNLADGLAALTVEVQWRDAGDALVQELRLSAPVVAP